MNVPHVCHVCTQASVPRKRPGSANIRSGEREDGQGKYEKGDEGADPEVLVLGYAARCTGATVAPLARRRSQLMRSASLCSGAKRRSHCQRKTQRHPGSEHPPPRARCRMTLWVRGQGGT